MVTTESVAELVIVERQGRCQWPYCSIDFISRLVPFVDESDISKSLKQLLWMENPSCVIILAIVSSCGRSKHVDDENLS